MTSRDTQTCLVGLVLLALVLIPMAVVVWEWVRL